MNRDELLGRLSAEIEKLHEDVYSRRATPWRILRSASTSILMTTMRSNASRVSTSESTSDLSRSGSGGCSVIGPPGILLPERSARPRRCSIQTDPLPDATTDCATVPSEPSDSIVRRANRPRVPAGTSVKGSRLQPDCHGQVQEDRMSSDPRIHGVTPRDFPRASRRRALDKSARRLCPAVRRAPTGGLDA